MEQPKNNLKIVADKKRARMILPNMLTLIGVCIGLTSIRFALDGRFELAIIAILFAAIIDGLDGRIARLIKGTSKVGKELDSLTDMISFGVAPAFIMYFWNLNTLGRFGWLLCLVYIICVALRLARFNVNSNQEPSWRDNFFEGVPSPAGGILVLTPLIVSLSVFEYIKFNYDNIWTDDAVTTSVKIGSGDEYRDYVYVDDVIDFIFKTLNQNVIGTYNLASGISTKTIEIFVNISGILGYKNDPMFYDKREGDIFGIELDNSKSISIGWSANTNLKNGLLNTINFLKDL